MWWLWIFIVRLKGYEGWSKDLFPGKIETFLSRSYRCTRVWWEMWESISLLGVTQYYTYPLTNIHTLIYIFKCWSVGKLVYINGFKCLLGFSHTLSTIWNWLQPKESAQIWNKVLGFRKELSAGSRLEFCQIADESSAWLFTIWLKAFWACMIQFQKVCQCLNMNSGAMFWAQLRPYQKALLVPPPLAAKSNFGMWYLRKVEREKIRNTKIW